MGVKSSSPETKTYVAHERFIQCQVKPQQQQIQSVIPVDFSPFDFQYWKKNVHQLKQDPNADLLFLPKSYDQHLPSFTCSTQHQLKLSFENYPLLLQQQISNRSVSNQPEYFQEQELWMLLYSLVKSQRAFCNLSLKVGDIHPHNIFLNAKGYPRLACQFSWPNEKTNFEKMYYEKILRYLSPEEMSLCQRGLQQDVCYANSSDAFSIGLTMLGTGLLDSLDKICDLKTFKFNQQYLDYCINRWMSLKFKHPQTNQFVSYSHELKDLVKNLCKVNPFERYLPSKIYDILQPYEHQIMNIQKFSLQNYKPLSAQLHQPHYHNQNQQPNLVPFTKPYNPQHLPIQRKEAPKPQTHLNKKSPRGYQNTSEHKVLFNYYSTLSHQKQGLVRNLPFNQFPQKKNVSQKDLNDIRRDLKLQFNESIIQQKTVIIKQDSRSVNALNMKLFEKQEKKVGEQKHIQFKSTYFEPPKITKSQFFQNSTLFTSAYIPVNAQIQSKSNFDLQLLLKIQKQIQESQQTFPEKKALEKLHQSESVNNVNTNKGSRLDEFNRTYQFLK